MPKTKASYRYTECGLDNVFIEDLEVMIDDKGAEVHCIPNILGLHKEIARGIICRHEHGMSGKELRFLRSEMGYTQEELADKLRVDRVTMSRWECGDQAISANAEVVVRLLAAEKLDIDPDMSVEELTGYPAWKAEATEIRIDGSNPKKYKPALQVAA